MPDPSFSDAVALAAEASLGLIGLTNEQAAWQAGTIDGGPTGNGNYPFTAPDGVVVMVPCPAKIAAMNGDPAAAAAQLQAKVDAANTAKIASVTAKTASETARDASAASAATADAAKTFVLGKVHDVDDATYAAIWVDASPDQNILFRVRRDTGALEFVYDATLAAAITNAGLVAGTATIANQALAAAQTLQARISDTDDAAYVLSVVDSTVDQNILFRVRRDTGALEFNYDPTLAAAIANATAAIALANATAQEDAMVRSGPKLKALLKPKSDATLGTVTPTTTTDATLTQMFSFGSNPELFTLYGGVVASDGTFVRAKAVSVTSGGNLGTGHQYVSRVAFRTNAPRIQISAVGVSTKFRIFVDGKPVSVTPITHAAPTGLVLITVDLPSGGVWRRIDYEFEQNGCFLAANTVRMAPGYGLVNVDTSRRFRIAVVADSLGAGAAATYGPFGWVPRLGHLLGGVDVDIVQVAIGTTGYTNAGGTGANTFGSASRVADVVALAPDLVIFAGLVNDGGSAASAVKAAALAAFQAVRAGLPNVAILVLGSWLNVSFSLATLQANENAVKEAVNQAGDPRIWFQPTLTDLPLPWIYGTGRTTAKTGDGNADWIVVDGVHWGDDGHLWVATKANTAVRAILPLI